jgi:hypothetical protein
MDIYNILQMLGREIAPKLSAIEAHKAAAAEAALDELEPPPGESNELNKLINQDCSNEDIDPEWPITWQYFELKATEVRSNFVPCLIPNLFPKPFQIRAILLSR